MLTVILLFPGGQRQEVLLAGVPRKGDSIQLAENGVEGTSLVVEAVTYVEGTTREPEPQVVVSVRRRPT